MNLLVVGGVNLARQPCVDRPALRLSDTKADATGEIWSGSLNSDDESRSDGCLFRLVRQAS